ncbi:MAG: M20/M25/M40 family metallo-hydrolase, partial [Candidatus Eisenbacteria bacterium]|nr:M20/M25/M40 family metallo-hydrolase [Candidatus Eisenbacteria bacterium]
MQGYEALEPKAVWQIFARMSAVPRPSGHEGAVMESLQKWAAERGLATRRDAVGNMVVSIPASPGREKAAPVVLQGHVDMVCEKNASVSHDFHADPIRMKVEDGWVRAEGTTLGADNGIGVSMALALAADSSVTHGPVEVLMTIDEERGLSGAKGIQAGFFQAKRMINLDSEEDDALFIGCAGGRDSAFDVPFLPGHVDPHWTGRAVAICGLTGGHSGLDIHRNRGNAIRILTRLLLAGWDATPLRIGAVSYTHLTLPTSSE